MRPFPDYGFADPAWLLALLLIPIVGVWYYRRSSNHYATLRWSNLSMLRNYQSWRGRLRVLLPVFRTIAFIALVVALARPQKELAENDDKSEGIDIMLTLDISSSMLARDIAPDRLTASKTMAQEFVVARPNDRIGLVPFAGEAFTQCPLTTDHGIVMEMIDGLRPGILLDKTAIGMGLSTAVSRIKDSEAKSKIIILLTDGDNTFGYIKPETAADIAAEFGIKVYTIGIGTFGVVIGPTGQYSNGEYVYGPVESRFDEALLQYIADKTGGQYFRAKTADDLRGIYDKIDKLEKTALNATTIKRHKDMFGWFVLVALMMLVMELALRYTIFRTIP